LHPPCHTRQVFFCHASVWTPVHPHAAAMPPCCYCCWSAHATARPACAYGCTCTEEHVHKTHSTACGREREHSVTFMLTRLHVTPWRGHAWWCRGTRFCVRLVLRFAICMHACTLIRECSTVLALTACCVHIRLLELARMTNRQR
jgi:hypothetical protein